MGPSFVRRLIGAYKQLTELQRKAGPLVLTNC